MGGNITDDGGASITARGVCWGEYSNPEVGGYNTTDGSGIGSFSSTITGLKANTTYYVRAYASNSSGTTYGNEVSFKTALGLPGVATNSVDIVTETTAQVTCYAHMDGGSPIMAYGVCWKTTPGPTVTDTKPMTVWGSQILLAK